MGYVQNKPFTLEYFPKNALSQIYLGKIQDVMATVLTQCLLRKLPSGSKILRKITCRNKAGILSKYT